MKRYWLFAGGTYYPGGGMKDFRGCFDSAEEALSFLETKDYCEWAHIYDAHSSHIIAWRDEDHAWRTGSERLEFWRQA